MSLPVTNLDDRKFQDLVDEAKRMIPQLCPEWTNHNLSDPGVALIELYAWMTEMTLFRLNQVPDAFYTRMLNLIGFEQFPASAARADLIFWLSAETADQVTVPRGTEITTTGTIGETRVFSTLEDAVATKAQLSAAMTFTGADEFVDVWDDLRLGLSQVEVFPNSPMAPGDCFYLGFDNPLSGNAVRLDVLADEVRGIGVVPTNPPLTWEMWHGEGWVPITASEPGDGTNTGGLNRLGNILLMVPRGHEPLILGGTRAYWVRARLLPPTAEQPAYRESPRISSVSAASVGVMAMAEHSETIELETLGSSSGHPDQRFVTTHAPVLPRQPLETIEVVSDESVSGNEVTAWDEVADFVNSDLHDRHFVWDSFTGEVRFGPLIRYPDGTLRQHGAVPDEGTTIRVSSYRTGGGAVGNVGAGTLSGMRTALPYVTGVINLASAEGGVDPETVENAKLRGPQSIRAGGRAVTVSDFERLSREADRRIARVRCLAPREPGDPTRLLVVPNIENPPQTLHLDEFALPDDMITNISEYLDDRRILGSKVEIGTPYYQGVTVAALIAPRPGRPPTLVRERALNRLYDYVNPLTGGPDGTGWSFDVDLNAALVFQLLEAVEGVERVEEVLFFEYDLRNQERLGFGKEMIKLAPDSLFLSSNHQVVVR